MPGSAVDKHPNVPVCQTGLPSDSSSSAVVRDMGLSAIIVTHDLAVVRLLADRLMVMKDGHVVENGLTDQVLDDPQHAYTQLLVSSVLQV